MKTLLEHITEQFIREKSTEVKPSHVKKIKKIKEGMFKDFNYDDFKEEQPPKNKSLQTYNELKHLQTLEEDKDFVKEMDVIEDVFESVCEKHSIEFPKEMVDKILSDSGGIILDLKYYHNRPRPGILAKEYNMKLAEVMLPSMKTPSYPSGHSVQGYLVGLYLADKFDNVKLSTEFMKAAKDISDSRNIARAHYISDSKFGEKLGKKLYEYIKSDIKIKENLLETIIEGFVNEQPMKAVKKDTNRVVVYTNKANYQAALTKGTHRQFDPVKDKNLEDTPEAEPATKVTTQDIDKMVDKAKAAGELPSDRKESSKEVYDTLYGKDNSLLQSRGRDDKSDAELSLGLGYVKGADHVAPGNAGSNFNENMSNEGVLILQERPELSEKELTQVLAQVALGTTISDQLSRQRPSGKIKIDGLRELDLEQRNLYSNAVMAARSAISKRNRALNALEQEGSPFGETVSMTTHGGTQRDLEQLTDQLNESERVYVYDSELGFCEIPKDVITNWVAQSGGGENAGDTVVLTTDETGNVLFDGWSDKTNLNDQQGNSTLAKELSNIVDTVVKLRREGRLDRKSARAAYKVAREYKQNIGEMEESYKDISSTNSEYFIESSDQLERFTEMAATSDDTKNHFENFQQKIEKSLCSSPPFKGESKKDVKLKSVTGAVPRKDKESDDKYFKRLCNQSKSPQVAFGVLARYSDDKLSTKNENKVIIRLAERERKRIKGEGQELPESLDTEKKLSNARQLAMDSHKQLYEDLEKIPVRSNSGKEKTLADVAGFEDAVNMFHLDKIASASDDQDFDQLLKRNTELMMEGIPVTSDDIKGCLGVSGVSELEDDFETMVEGGERYTTAVGSERITGKVVIIYAVSKTEAGERIRTPVGEKVYRTKDGRDGKTQTVIKWSGEMQECFDKKEQPQESAPPQLRKLIRDITLWKLGKYGN